ncbi:MAG TPA: 2-dehydropantoate 2-reductase [Candidatus Tumulicola sp.]|jgi:2-dehydropantoate 2-reductase
MRVAVIGSGAIGGFLAGALARGGLPVAVVARGEHLAAIRRDGLRIESDLGSFRVAVEASDDLRQLGAFDVLLLAFKAHQWPPLLPQLADCARAGATVVTFQNGVPFWYVRVPTLHSVDPEGRIGATFSDEQVLGGVVHVSGSVPQPGLVRQSGGLRYVLGDPRGLASERLDVLVAAMRAAGLEAQADPDVRATVWLKLVNNVGLNAVSTLRRLTIRPLLADPDARAEVRALMSEALEIGRAIGVVDAVDLDARLDYAARLDDVKTSMLQDFERGRELEIEPILGAAIELAERYGVGVPGIRAAYAALRRFNPPEPPSA